ncbi:PucR family transcriptional regulator ligand-binding domain-containing protein [Neobacillus drentensis]|uniref:PucR family transcriptional regulator ligand-binding domain-containing protein n=1 Tax=Neobacillus drentensis TaxID=220684 RepID=UPI002FFED935
MIRVKDLTNLQELEHFKLVAGSEGLNKIVSWPFICQELMIENWVKGSELLFFTGIGVEVNEETLINLVEQCFRSHIAGIVVLLNDNYIQAIPDGMINKANQYNIPLFIMPWDIPLIQVTKIIADYIHTFSKDEKMNNEVFKRFIQMSSTSTTDLEEFTTSSQVNHYKYNYFVMIMVENQNDQTYNLANYIAWNHFNTGLFNICDNEICFFIGENFSVNIEQKCQDVINFINLQKNDTKVKLVGISDEITNQQYLRNYYKQAQDALFSAMIRNERIKKFNDTGIRIR